MKFAIIGAGVMGSLVGALLKKAGEEVWLVDTNPVIIEHIRQHGLKVEIGGKEETVSLNVAQTPDSIKETMDVVLFLVKGCYTEAAASSAQCLVGPNTYVMTLQNGLGNVEILAKYYNFERILYGILEFAGKPVDVGHVKGFISANSKICFGPASHTLTGDMQKIADILGKSDIKVILEDNIDGEVWIKLRNNSTNAVFGLLRLTIGQALAAEGTEEVIKAVRDEVIAVAKAKGVSFATEQLVVNGGKTSVNPELYAHLPSTAYDMLHKNRTEIEFINGAVYKEGQRLGVPTPYNELLYRLVKIMENTYDMQI